MKKISNIFQTDCSKTKCSNTSKNQCATVASNSGVYSIEFGIFHKTRST